jgi:predicted permease
MLALILPICHLSLIDEFRELWIIPLFFILISGVSLVVARLLAFVFRLNHLQRYVSVPILLSISHVNTFSRNFAMAASMIMNSNSLPVALLQSLAVSVPGLEWGQDDTIDSIIARALAYTLLSGTMGQFVSFFSTTNCVGNFTIFRFVGVTGFNYSQKQFLQTRLSTSLRLAMKTAYPPKAWNV